jgi:putative ABC transport system permease protein
VEEAQMFFNLAWRNAKRSRSDNLIYFLTMVTAVAAFYIVLSLGKQDVIRFLEDLESDAVNRLLTTIMPAFYMCALLFVFFLVVFADKYQLECRSREMGLYLMLGMTKKRLFSQIMTEGMITSLLALCGGIVCGGFLSEIISLATSRLVGQGIITHQSSFSIGAVIFTVLGFLLIQSVALFILGRRLFHKEINQLLYGEMEKKQNVGNARSSFLTLVLGAVALMIAYWLVMYRFLSAGGAMLLIAVIFGIAGTIFFIRGIARLLSILAGAAKSKVTHGLYTFTLRQMQENITNKYVSIGVASILMMLTIMMIADGSSIIMSYTGQMTRGASVYDFTVMGEDQTVEEYLVSEQIRPYVSDLNRMEIGKMKRPEGVGMNTFVNWSGLREQIVQNLPAGVEDPATQNAVSYEIGAYNPPALNLLALIDTSSATPYLIPVSAYNRLLEASGENALTLKDDEAVFYLNPDFFGTAQEDAVSMMDEILTNVQLKNEELLLVDVEPFSLVPSVPMKGLTADTNVEVVTALIVSDDVFDKYVNPDTYTVYWNFCIPEELAENDGLMRSIMETSHLLKASGLVYESYLNNFGRQLFYIISESYTMLYMGFIFLIIACALLALQFLTQMQATKRRYLTLSMLGARREQMKKSMHRQVLWYFLLPLFLACISGTVGLCAMQKYLHSVATGTGQSYSLMIIMAGIVILVLAVYAVAVARTADHEVSKLNWKPNS